MKKIINILVDYRKQFGLFALLRLMFFPLTLFYFNTRRLIISVWSSRILASGRWGEYNRYRANNAINSLFYWTQAINFERYGRRGISNYVGTGNYQLGSWWHASLTSTQLYWHLGALLPFFCMVGWLCSHLLWGTSEGVGSLWLLTVLLFALISTCFYAGAFVVLNYNAFGWLFMPLGMFAILNDSYALAAAAWLAASLGSITVVAIAGVISLVWALVSMNWLPLMALVPAVLKIFSHLLFCENIKDTLLKTAKSIGLVPGGAAKYPRSQNQKAFTIPELYMFCTYLVFSVSFYCVSPELSSLSFAVVLLFVINKKIARFADEQSIYLAMFCIATPLVIISSTPWLLVPYWFVISPLPLFMGSSDLSCPFDDAEAYKPFHISPLLDKCNDFLSHAPKNSRVLLALENPQGQYEKVFDGYRVIYELAFYSGNVNETLVFPDWWAVFANNQEESPEFWGRSPEEVKARLKQWKADYVLIYQPSGTALVDEWGNQGFTVLSQLDWGELLTEDLRAEACWGKDNFVPCWWLLRSPEVLQ